MIILGFDPGLSGGVAAIYVTSNGSSYADAVPMPLAGKELDVSRLSEFIHQIVADHPMDMCIAYVEKVHPMPKNGSISSFKLGQGYGTILGVLGTLGISIRLVAPQTWKAKILKDTDKSKAAAVDYCVRSYPSVNLIPPGKRSFHDGMADALCIAEYGLRERTIHE